MKLAAKCLILAVMLGALHHAAAQGKPVGITDSVVKIVNQYNRFDWYNPWDSGSTGKGTGSGFVISKNRILTNAHVVSDTAMLLVYFHNDPTPYPARVVAVGHECDLAILALEDESRMAGIPPLEFDGLPALRSRVVTYGYPAGGLLISSTVGVVSRIEPQVYVHSGTASLLAVQTDAAINPGNSGGPVIQNGKVVGVAFQGNRNLENMGFFIPVQVVEHFLTDLEDGKFDGTAYLGIQGANLENPAARKYSGMKEGETGIRIESIAKNSCTDGILEADDIITEIDGYPVANDGTVQWNNLRFICTFLTNLKQVGDKVHLKIIRGSEHLEKTIVLDDFNPMKTRANLYDVKPSYYVYAGMVFVPLNREVLETYSNNWVVDAPQELVYESYYRARIEDGLYDVPRVIQIRRLDHEVNAEEAKYLYRLIETVNDKPIQTLSDLIKAFEGNQEEHHVIRFTHGNRSTVLNREQADAANEEILRKYAIPQDRRL